MIEPADAGLPLRRAYLRVGGRSLARHQLDLAGALECARIICISRAVEPELIALQHVAEAAGMKFHVISSPQELGGLIAERDEIIVFSEGLLAAPDEATRLLEESQAVVVQPVETGVSAGFERIDLNHAAAGLMRIPGRLVEQLFELPPDCDVPSALTRIALQAGVAMRSLPANAQTVFIWAMIRSESEAYAAENRWLTRQLEESGASTPGRAVARAGVMTFGSSLLHSGNAGKAAALATIALLIFALGLGWLGAVIAGLMLCALAWISYCATQLLYRIENPKTGEARSSEGRIVMLGWLLDLVLVVLVFWSGQQHDPQPVLYLAFAPVMLLLLVRLVPQIVNGSGAVWVGDRTVLALILAAAAGFGILTVATPVLATILAAVCIVGSAGKRG